MPLLRDGAAIGAIAMASVEIGGFTDSQVALLQTFAEQAVIAITSAETYRELQQRTDDLQESLEYQTATSDVLKVISRSTSDVQPVLDTVVETAARLCGADAGTISLREGEVYRYVVSALEAEPEFWASIASGPLSPVATPSPDGWRSKAGSCMSRTSAPIPDYAMPEAVAAGTRTVLGVPLLREGEVLGTINLARKRVQAYTERQIELVRTFADQAVIAIENARLLGELQQRTDELAARNSEFGERIEHQSATIDVLKVMSASPGDPQPVFDLMAGRARPDLCDTNINDLDTNSMVNSSIGVDHGLVRRARGSGSSRAAVSMVRNARFDHCRAILDRQDHSCRDMATAPGVSAAVAIAVRVADIVAAAARRRGDRRSGADRARSRVVSPTAKSHCCKPSPSRR